MGRHQGKSGQDFRQEQRQEPWKNTFYRLSQLPILYNPRLQAQCLPAHSWLGLLHLSLIIKKMLPSLIDLPVGQFD